MQGVTSLTAADFDDTVDVIINSSYVGRHRRDQSYGLSMISNGRYVCMARRHSYSSKGTYPSSQSGTQA